MERRRIVIILGRERDVKPGEFGLKFGFGGLGDEGQFAIISPDLDELAVTEALRVLNKSIPADRDFNSCDSHKCYQ
jgi:hypothetical protein